jgi:hypothetical protein
LLVQGGEPSFDQGVKDVQAGAGHRTDPPGDFGHAQVKAFSRKQAQHSGGARDRGGAMIASGAVAGVRFF